MKSSTCFYFRVKKMKFSRFRLRTFPVIVNGPFGIVSAAELIGILMFAAYIICAAYAYTIYNFHLVSKMHLPSKENRYVWDFELNLFLHTYIKLHYFSDLCYFGDRLNILDFRILVFLNFFGWQMFDLINLYNMMNWSETFNIS